MVGIRKAPFVRSIAYPMGNEDKDPVYKGWRNGGKLHRVHDALLLRVKGFLDYRKNDRNA